MEDQIIFPHLGITLEHVGKSISVFGIEIAYYGIIIALGILTGFLLAQWIARRTGQDPEVYLDLILYAVFFAIVGARLYYVIFSWDMFRDDLLSIFNLRNGGLAIYGGVIGAVLTVYVFSKKRKLSFPLMLDTGGPGLLPGKSLAVGETFSIGRLLVITQTACLPCSCRCLRSDPGILRRICGSIFR